LGLLGVLGFLSRGGGMLMTRCLFCIGCEDLRGRLNGSRRL